MTTPVPTRPTVARSVGKPGLLPRFLHDAGGATAIEYAMITGVFFLAIVTSVNYFASRMDGMYNLLARTIGKE